MLPPTRHRLRRRNFREARCIVDSITQASDIRLSGPPDPNVDCDGISVGFRFFGTTVESSPAVPEGCPEI